MKIVKLNNTNFKKFGKYLNSNICFVGIFSKNCIHCKMIQPEWEKLKKQLKKKKCNGVLLEVDSNQLNYINYSSFNNNINGFPTIALYKNGKIVKEYDGNRTSNNMYKFLQPYLIYNKTIRNKKTTKNTRKLL